MYVGAAASGVARAGGGKGAVATNPWSGNGFWSTIGGGPDGDGLG